MKKLILITAAFAGLLPMSKAQTVIPNGGFETWTNLGSATAQPLNWNSNKTGGGLANFGPETCYQDTSTLGGGSYCVKIMTGSIIGTVVNGSCTTGEVEAPTSDKADGYIETIAGDSLHSAPFSGRPDSLVFWYRYSPATGTYASDTPSVQARLHVGNAYAPEAPSNNNHPDSTVNIIARALWLGPGGSQATWQRVSVPFVYVDGRTPEYILITMTSSADNVGGNDSSILWVDQIQAIYNSTGIDPISEASVKTYWRGNELVADLSGQNLSGARLRLFGTNGQLITESPLDGNGITAIPTDVTPGVYVYRIISAEATLTGKTIRQ